MQLITLCVQVINKPCVRESRYMRLISWTLQSSSEQLAQRLKKRAQNIHTSVQKNAFYCTQSTRIYKYICLSTVHKNTIVQFSCKKKYFFRVSMITEHTFFRGHQNIFSDISTFVHADGDECSVISVWGKGEQNCNILHSC